MSDESDFDDDIDKLLDEIDSVGTQKKQASGSNLPAASKPSGTSFASLLSKSGPPKDAGKDDDDDDGNGGAKLTLKSDGEIRVNYQNSGFKLSDFNRPPAPVSPVKEPPKSVRFPENPQSQPSQPQAQPQPPRSSFLSNLLGKQDTPGSSGPSSLKGQSSAVAGSGAGAKSDWLGIGAGGSANPDSLSPPDTPAMSLQKRFGAGSTTGSGTRGIGNESTINFDDDTEDNEELLRAMGLDVSIKSKSKQQQPRSTAGAGTGSQLKPKAAAGFDLDDDFWPKKPAPAPASKKQEPEPDQSTQQPSTATAKLRSSLLQKSRDFHIEDSPFESSPQQQQQTKFQPTVASTPAPKSIVDVLPFLKKPQTDPLDQLQPEPLSLEMTLDRDRPGTGNFPPSMRSLSPAQYQQQQQQQQFGQRPPSVSGPGTAAGKTGKGKKAAAAATAAAAASHASTPVPHHHPQGTYHPSMDSNRSTLNLPSHLVDEDELKSMCNSLKTLYSTQLEMQEKSYQEQMDCLMQSHSRKEDLLKDEIKVIHKEYDARLGRLKTELLETETKLPQRLQSELAAMKTFTDYQLQRAPYNASINFQNQSQNQNQLPVGLSSATATAQEHSSTFAHSPRGTYVPSQDQNTTQNQSTNNSEIAPNISVSIIQDLTKVFDDKVNIILETLHQSTVTALKSELNRKQDLNSKETKELSSKLDSMQRRLDSFAKYKVEEESKKNILLIESDKKLHGELAKLTKQQKKLKESVVKAAVASVSQTLQYNLDESSSKKDKIASQLKEFRKDVRRVLFDLETKNEGVQKSHVSMESDQKQIIETLRELQTLIQINSARNPPLPYGLTFPSNNNASIQSVHNQQQIQQSEMEIKLLREERNSLSESISHMNVERRKLNEEKIHLERDKMDFERDKNKMRDLEVQLKIKIAEAEDVKKQAEEVRRAESSKTIESTMKLTEIEKERAAFKEQYHTAEQRLRIREQKLIQEKTELMREKEFLEKLRDQLMCPGCMKSVQQLQLNSRSDGDGLDFSAYSNTDNASASISSKLYNPNSTDAKYFVKESLYLDDLFYKQFNAKQS